MVSKLVAILSTLSCLLLTGCGTNVFTELKAVGVDASVPIYGTVVGVRVGQSEITTAATRGNTTFVSQNTSGGGLLSTTAGVGRVSSLKSGPMVNEGYIKDILTSPNVPETAKVSLVQDYLARSAPEVMPAATKTIGAATGSGDKPPVVEPVVTGVDRVIDKTAETVQEVAPPVVNATKDVVNNTVTTAGNVTNQAMVVITIAVVVCGIILVVLLIWLLPKVVKLIKAKLKKKSTVETVVEAVTHQTTTVKEETPEPVITDVAPRDRV